MRLAGAPIASPIACWDWPSAASTTFMTRNSGGCRSISASRWAKRRAAWMPDLREQEAEARGGPVPALIRLCYSYREDYLR